MQVRGVHFRRPASVATPLSVPRRKMRHVHDAAWRAVEKSTVQLSPPMLGGDERKNSAGGKAKNSSGITGGRPT